MKVSVKRVYDTAEKEDGCRILVDRLWPRGITKEEAKIDEWLKDITPSTELRNWFHENKKERYEEFARRYHEELVGLSEERLEILRGKDEVTLVTAVKDIEHSHIPTLKSYLEE